MLILTRKKSEAIRIPLPDGTEIRFVVCGVRGEKAKIGIVAPRELHVLRDELPDRDPSPEPTPQTDAPTKEELAAA